MTTNDHRDVHLAAEVQNYVIAENLTDVTFDAVLVFPLSIKEDDESAAVTSFLSIRAAIAWQLSKQSTRFVVTTQQPKSIGVLALQSSQKCESFNAMWTTVDEVAQK
uniref:Uncharacterized protein n=1 Tax=Romanomermis culicivorax TaxID=13658 RepID=A0A915L633_ROMCU